MGLLRRKKKEPEEAGFAEDAVRQERRRLTPVEIQQKVFRLAFRGYNERDVDEFLDQVTEEIAGLHEENKRLQEELELARGGSDVSEEAKRRAEETVRRAREHAARLIEDAEQRGGGGRTSAAYLVREREFLQQLASLVQERAGALKEEARRARSNPGPSQGKESGSNPFVATEPESTPPPPEEGPPPPGPTAAPPGGDPSLRELFWGDE